MIYAVIAAIAALAYSQHLLRATAASRQTKKYHQLGCAFALFGFLAHLASARYAVSIDHTPWLLLAGLGSLLFAFWFTLHAWALERLLRAGTQ